DAPMPTSALKFVLCCSLTLAGLASSAPAYEVVQISTDRGNVPLYLPSDPDPGSPLPLVVSLHGYTGNGTEHENYFNLRSRVDERQFMLCVPNGITNSQGDRFWNATDVCCDFSLQRPDDSGYLRALIETIAGEHPVDLQSIHVTGHSNGGFMAYRMACDNADLIASIASLAGATFNNPSNCTPSEPVHVLQVHGTADTVIEYEGGCFFPFFCYPGAMQSVLIWSKYNQCSGMTDNGPALDLVGNISGAETSRFILAEGCAENGECELWSINGGNHGPSFNGNFARELVDWLLAHRRPDPINCSADLNGDLVIDGIDLGLLLVAWSTKQDCRGEACDADLDGDNRIDGVDLGIFLSAWGADCS
ncbi:MAG: alpha/beta hydrolase-fold protein, partial [Phycisphaerales bacterium]|nr:alpha/beta hydrolase-fold protein [Phycisphaerales bacterium]